MISLFIWLVIGLFYIGGVIWSFKGFWDQDNLLYKKKEPWYSPEHDEHIGI